MQADKGRRRLIQGGRMVAVVAGVLLAALGASSLGARPTEDIAGSPELAAGYAGSAENVLATAGRLSKRHPASYFLAATTAKTLWKLRDPRAFALLARTLSLNPNHHGVHLLAAEMLVTSQRPRQALAEYRAALAIPGPSSRILRSLEAHFPDVADLVLAVPDNAIAEKRNAPTFLQLRRADVALTLVRRALARTGPKPYDLYSLGVRAALAADETTLAVQIGKEAHATFGTVESLLLYVSALRSNSLPLLALSVLGERNYDNNVDYLDTLSTLQIEVEDLKGARLTLEKLMHAHGDSAKLRRIVHGRLATIEDLSGNHHQAKWHREQSGITSPR